MLQVEKLRQLVNKELQGEMSRDGVYIIKKGSYLYYSHVKGGHVINVRLNGFTDGYLDWTTLRDANRLDGEVLLYKESSLQYATDWYPIMRGLAREHGLYR